MQYFGSSYTKLIDIDTPRLYLRKARMSDANDIYEYSKDPNVARYVLWDAHRSVNESKDYIRYLIRLYRKNKPSSYVIQSKADNKVIGTIGFMWINAEYASAEVGYSLSRQYWNRGYMSEALEALIHYGFEKLGLNRIEGQHDIRNEASGSVMRKVGMLKEGVLRQRMRNKGQYVDVALYAILHQDWVRFNKLKKIKT